jgi:isopenicillin N synthase-like dioxygenase
VGYLPREREALDESRPPDLKEAFNVPPPVPAGAPAPTHRAWPDPADPLRAEAEAFAARCFDLGQEVLAAIALALDLPETFFTAGHRAEDQTLRLLHYFPAEPGTAPRQLGAGDHSDHGTLTLLFQDGSGGLEMLDRGGVWHPLPPVAGTVLVNAGDLLARWTGGAVRSAPHRVLATPRHRYSLAYFLIPRFEVVLRCPPTAALAGTAEDPPPLTAEEFLLLRSLRRSERFYRHQGPRPDAGSLPKGLADMRSLVAERLGLDQAGLDRRLADFGPGDPRDATMGA